MKSIWNECFIRGYKSQWSRWISGFLFSLSKITIPTGVTVTSILLACSTVTKSFHTFLYKKKNRLF